MMRWWVERDGRRLDVAVRRLGEKFEVTIDGRTELVEWTALSDGLSALLCPDGRTFGVAHQRLGPRRFRVAVGQGEYEIALRDLLERSVESGPAGVVTDVLAPIPGKVLAVHVVPGQEVSAGTILVVLEAMKMENPLTAEAAARVESVLVAPGMTVVAGQTLIRYFPPS